MSVKFQVNSDSFSANVEPDTPLLWVLGDELSLTGTKFGCSAARCGACTVDLDGHPIHQCQTTPVSAVAGKKAARVEGLSKNDRHPLQAGWIKHDVLRGGYFQSRQRMSATALLRESRNPDRIDEPAAAEAGSVIANSVGKRVRQLAMAADAICQA